MIGEFKKEYIKTKRIVRRVFLVLIFISLLLIGLKLLKDVGGVVLFPIKRIVVYGNEYVGSKDVVKILGIGPTTSIISLNRNKAVNSLKEDLRIETAVIVKVYPDSLKIYIKEKSPLIPLEVGNEYYAISSDGVVLGKILRRDEGKSPSLKILNYDDIKVGEKLDNFLIQNILGTLKILKDENDNILKTIDRISVKDSGVFVSLEKGKYDVYLGDNVSKDVFKRLEVLITVLKNSIEPEGDGQIVINMSFSHAAVKIGE